MAKVVIREKTGGKRYYKGDEGWTDPPPLPAKKPHEEAKVFDSEAEAKAFIEAHRMDAVVEPAPGGPPTDTNPPREVPPAERQ